MGVLQKARRLQSRSRGQPFAGYAVGDGFGDVDAAGLGCAVEIGEGAGDLHDAVIGAGGEFHLVGSVAQELKAAGIDIGNLFDQRGRAMRVGGDAGDAERCVTLRLDMARGGDAFGDAGASARRGGSGSGRPA